MNSKERVQAALQKRPVDRVPIFMWYHPATANHLSRLLEIPLAALNEALFNDVRQTWVSNNYAMEGITHEHDGDGHVDEWGIRWVKQYYFNQIAAHPLEHASPQECLAYRFPTGASEKLLRLMEPVAAESATHFIGCDVSPCAYEMYWRLRGMENTLVDMLDAPDLAQAMLRRCVDFSITLAAAAIQRYPLDWLWTGDDAASQQGMLISPALWRRLIKPELARLFALARPAGLRLAFHCCGALRPIIPDLIEIGMDVLNPVQAGCPGMNALDLKRDFGGQIAFMGGLDTQELLPHGSPTEVRGATEALISGMTADGGGYILAASHTIPPETPDENIFAMFAAVGISRAQIFDQAADLRARLQAGTHGQ